MSPRKRLIIFATVVVGFVLLLVLIFGRGSGNNNQKTTKPVPNKPIVLTDYADKDSKVVLNVSGQINGDDIHREIRITVTRGNRRLEVIQGYQGNVIQTQNFVNNPDAYDTFIRALARINFGKERKTSQTDERGVCATGQRYIFEVYDNNDRISRTWSATCIKGTSLAAPALVLQLFRAQITDYAKLTQKVELSSR